MDFTDQQIVQQAMSRTLARRLTDGVPDYQHMSDEELIDTLNTVYASGEIPMWELVRELSDRFERCRG